MLSEEKAEGIIKAVYSKLVKKLPLDDKIFVASLIEHNLLPGDTHERINDMKTRTDKVTHLINVVIMPGSKIHLPNLVKAMKHCDNIDVKQFAKDIEMMMGSGRIYLFDASTC